MPRLALVAINAKYSQTNLALLYLRAALAAEVPSVCFDLIEWDINRPPRELLEMISEGDFSHAVFSIYIWNSRYIADLLADLNQLKKRPITCAGGPEAVYNKTLWLEKPGLDYIFEGAAEHFAAVLPSLGKPESSRAVSAEMKRFTETLFPYDPKLLGSLRGRLVYYEASRGCAFRCSYCLSSRSDTAVEYRTQPQIIRELGMLVEFKGTVKFVDRTFNANPEISRLIWKYMAQHPPSGCFHFEIHPLLLEEEDLFLLKCLPPGSAQLEIGIQSVNPSVRKNVNRAGSWKHERQIIEELSGCGLFHIHLDQIAGLPGDSPATAADSIDEIMKLKPDNFQLGFLKVLPGTPLTAEKEKWGIRHEQSPPYEILESSTFSFSQLMFFHRIEKLISRIYNSGYFKLSLGSLSEEAGSWFRLLKDLLSTGPDLDCRRWEYWGSILMNYIELNFPHRKPLYIDLLRLDWCPFAGGQHYADFLRYADAQKISSLRRKAIEETRKKYPGTGKPDLNRAILFLPEHPELSGKAAALFFKDQDGRKKIEFETL